MQREKTLLIVDDIEINRMILADAFQDTYNILEAGDGEQALEIIGRRKDISAVLLDLLMPKKDGLDVLRDMNRTGKIKYIPVFLITAADSTEMLLEGYNLGAIDIIRKPFMTQFLQRRVDHIVELYEQRNELEHVVKKQVEKFNRLNRSLVEMLASIIEFRDCESGEHVKRMSGLTKILMTEVGDTYPEYAVREKEIEKIGTASILHDIGKIAIPDKILNKPGRLTNEEFEIMKQHTVKGCEILRSMPNVMDRDIYNYSYDICRHHHERWDGKGYPDGLSGDNISIWAQVVSVVDVYDALTSERVYKSAYDSGTAVRMILNGECGAFNPKILKAFEKIVERL
ncbi:MAG: response regulator [Lachnospiraceae bacterium]|nr:response regulator [Lachnospiraceae bacterium]